MPRFALRYMNGEIRIGVGQFTIGRSSENNLPLDDEQVSRHHAVLVATRDALEVQDLDSRNGVYVNGEAIEGKAALGHNDQLRVGGQEMLVVVAEERARRARKTTVDGGRAADTDVARGRPKEPLSALSPRERQVARLLSEGHTHKEVAAELGISVKTVETHRARIYTKLEVRSRAELVRLALSAGLLRSS